MQIDRKTDMIMALVSLHTTYLLIKYGSMAEKNAILRHTHNLGILIKEAAQVNHSEDYQENGNEACKHRVVEKA